MKFILIDKITLLEERKRLVAQKALSLAEEYLADHFARFPVLPGVLMLEAMIQASSWIVQSAHDFRHGLVVLKEARNVTYKSFVSPGQVLTIESVCREINDNDSAFSARGFIGDREMVKAALTLRHLNLSDTDAALADVDNRLRLESRARFALLSRGLSSPGPNLN